MERATPASGLERVVRPRLASSAWVGSTVWVGLLLFAGSPGGAVEPGPPRQRCVVLEIYGREGDPKVAQAAAAIDSLKATRGGITYNIRLVDREARYQARLEAILKHFQLPLETSPIIYGGNRVLREANGRGSWREQLQELLRIEVFVRSGCTRCASAKAWLPTFASDYPGFELVYRDILADPASAAEVNRLIQQHRVAAASVPIIHALDQLIVGFESTSTTGERLRSVFDKWTHPCPATPAPGVRSSRDGARVDRLAFFLSRPQPTGEMIQVAKARFVSYRRQNEASGASDESVRQGQSAIVAAGLGSAEDLPLPSTEASASEQPLGDLPLEEPGLPLDVAPTNDRITLPLFGTLQASKLGLPLFTLAVGLIDGFNPCAMWVLLFLLSILVNLRERVRILAIAGTFVLISGLAYFAFMAAWINVLSLVGYLRPVQLGLAGLALLIGAVHIKDFFAFKQGFSLSIPESAKPGIYARVRRIVTAEHLTGAVLGAITLAVLVNFVELLCTAGLPALYTSILAQQAISTPMWYAYLSLYIAAYMLDDCLMLAVVIATLSKQKLQESHGRWLKLISGAAIFTLGLIMLFRPDWLY
jgi:hypothetical protein